MIKNDGILEFSDSLPCASHDCPFNEDFETTVLRHSDTKRWFGLLFFAPCEKVGAKMTPDGKVQILNLKCDPALSFGLCGQYRGIVPAYHMNKFHWISVVLDSDVPFDVLKGLIRVSYDLTARK